MRGLVRAAPELRRGQRRRVGPREGERPERAPQPRDDGARGEVRVVVGPEDVERGAPLAAPRRAGLEAVEEAGAERVVPDRRGQLAEEPLERFALDFAGVAAPDRGEQAEALVRVDLCVDILAGVNPSPQRAGPVDGGAAEAGVPGVEVRALQAGPEFRLGLAERGVISPGGLPPNFCLSSAG